MSDHDKQVGGDEPVVHQYDDIQECDNHLPNWWLATLYGTIAFAAFYWISYEGLAIQPGPRGVYMAEVAAAKAADASKAKALGDISADALVKMSKDPATVASGKEIFTTTCVACHGATAGGGIGPNLTDDTWLHGGKPLDVYKTVRDGWPQKGMVAWGPSLGEERVRTVAAYVLSLKNSNVSGGKAPQGEKEVD